MGYCSKEDTTGLQQCTLGLKKSILKIFLQPEKLNCIFNFRLAQDLGLESQIAVHLAETYGDRAFAVGESILIFIFLRRQSLKGHCKLKGA